MNFCMLRFVKQIVWLVGIVLGCQSAFGFALIGPIPPTGTPDSTFQVPAIGYGVGGDLGTPKDVKEEYRRNTPVLYYAFDSSFFGYFREHGMAEADKAMAMYNSVGKVSSYSQELTEFPQDSRRENFRAQAAGLLDLKSYTMGLLTEQLGFFEPTRWVWALHARAHLTPGPPCPANMVYTVYQRNFSIVPPGEDTYPTTSYVNGVLYSYDIQEFCAGVVPLADAVEFPVDPLSSPFSAVADYVSLWYEGLPFGGFYTSLTRDDVAGLRYLISTNNLNNEASGLRTTEFLTNSEPAAIQTQDLSLFATQALTNNALALSTLYPGLVITSTTTSFGLTVTTNVTQILVNFPTDPAGTLPSHALNSTNFTTNFVTFFHHTFGNLVTNTYANKGLFGTVTLGLANAPFAVAGTLPLITTNVKPAIVSGVFGDFFILPTNLCSALILSNLLTTVIATTNPPTATVPALTNAAITFTPGSVTFFTNHIVVYLPVTCPVDSVANRGGVDRIQFVRRDYDSLISQFWDPVTNNYTVPELIDTNGTIVIRHFSRRVPRPDIVFSAVDFAANATFTYSNTVDNLSQLFTFTLTGVGQAFALRNIVFNDAGRLPNLAGPGTIEGPGALPTLFVFNKLAPLFDNASSFLGTNNFLLPNELTQVKEGAWGSFDGTTNAPVVYPNGTSLEERENLITGPMSNTPTLPDANIGVPYSAQLSAVGGHGAPYTWSLAPGSPGLPDGLNLDANGKITGTPTGPASIYDFTLRLTDSAGTTRDVQYTISVF
jgi:hypothetical protein